MIKQILLTVIMSTTMASLALADIESSSEIQVVDVNCNNVSLDVSNDRGDSFEVTAHWTEEAQFPNPPTEISVGDEGEVIKRFSFTCPNLAVVYDGNMFEIKANSIDEILNKPFFKPLASYEDKVVFDFYRYSSYSYPSIQQGFYSNGYSINLKDYTLDAGWTLPIKEGEKTNDLYIPKEAVIGYKLDGGELKPLLFNQYVSTYQEAFRQANTIDIYHKYESDNEYLNRETKLERIFIDKPSATIRFYKKFEFPNS